MQTPDIGHSLELQISEASLKVECRASLWLCNNQQILMLEAAKILYEYSAVRQYKCIWYNTIYLNLIQYNTTELDTIQYQLYLPLPSFFNSSEGRCNHTSEHQRQWVTVHERWLTEGPYTVDAWVKTRTHSLRFTWQVLYSLSNSAHTAGEHDQHNILEV